MENEMIRVILHPEEETIFEKLKKCGHELRKFIPDYEYRKTLVSHAGDLAFELYNSLINRGILAKFNKESLRNRTKDIRKGPDSREFYDHPDIINDLLRFVECPSVHDEIGDVTIGVPFSLSVWSNYEKKDIHFTVERTVTGWKSFLITQIIDDKNCSKLIYALMDVYKISTPRDLEDYFIITWEQAAEGELSQGDLALRLNDLMHWVSSSEKNKTELG